MRHGFVLLSAVILLGAAAVISAAPPPNVTCVTPKDGDVIRGSDYEVSVSFTATAEQPVTRVEVILDGRRVTEQINPSALTDGECAFLWDTVRTADGAHQLDVKTYSGEVLLCQATCTVRVANKEQSGSEAESPAADTKPPRARIQSPKDGETVSGAVPVMIQAGDDSGKSPYVSVFVDKALKSVTNHEPYTYAWDSTEAENGPHEIHVSAMDDSENRTVTLPVKVIVRNPMTVGTSVSGIVLPEQGTSALPRESSSPPAESARSASVSAERLEARAASQVGPEGNPGNGEVIPPSRVETVQEPRPEVHVLVSGPVEFGVPAKVEVASAAVDGARRPAAEPALTTGPKVLQYTVQSGDALEIIARKFGTSVSALVEANNIENPSLIRIGQKLTIAGAGGSVMVPLRPVLDKVGGRMGWDQKKHAVHAWAPGIELRVWVGSSQAEVNDQKVLMEKPAALVAGRTMVPRSFVTENLNLDN